MKLNPVDNPERFEVTRRDHGFLRGHPITFPTLEAARAFIAGKPSGRLTSFTGRNVEDIAWWIKDTETGEYVS